MAKVSEKLKEKILAYYKAGISQRKLAIKYKLSPATINKICKDVIQENEHLVNAQVAINTQLATKSEQEVNAIKEIVNKKTKHLLYFQNSALKNQKKANDILDATFDLEGLERHSRITARNKETV